MVTWKYFKKERYNIKCPRDLIKLKASIVFLKNKNICDITIQVSGQKSENWSWVTVNYGMDGREEVGAQKKSTFWRSLKRAGINTREEDETKENV